MFKRILFPTDFAERSARAQACTLDLAKLHGASVELLHAIEPIPSEDPHAFDDFYATLEKRAGRLAARTVEAFHAANVPCTVKILIEKRWRAISKTAEADAMDLIVMGSRGPAEREGIGGTTSHKVFLSSHVPILFVR